MKKNILYISGFIFITVISSSCKKYLDINQNPNSGTEPPINGLLANTTYNTAYNVFNISNYTSYYVQYLASPNPSSAVDIYDNVNGSGTWEAIYNNLTDLYDMRRFAAGKSLNAYVGVSDILLALHINMASNLWGDIPYSESFLGVSNLTPILDDQKALYDTCLSLINAGITELQQPNASGEMNPASDFIHAGSVTAWIKTAHALKARMLNQLSKTSDYNADDILLELAAAYTSNADDAQVTSFEVRNPWAQVALNNAGLDLDGWLSTYFVKATNGVTYSVFDPRLPLITDTTKYGDYRGTQNGAGRVGTGTKHEECYVAVDKWYSSTNSPLQIITYAECKFIEAEAEFRKGNKIAADSAYIKGIIANMQKMSVDGAAIIQYTTDPAVNVSSANLTLELIMKEKYVACFLSPVTWDDMRRFDYMYKNFSLPLNAVISSFIRRMNYPTVEISTNGANVPSVQVTDHLWWDQ